MTWRRITARLLNRLSDWLAGLAWRVERPRLEAVVARWESLDQIDVRNVW